MRVNKPSVAARFLLLASLAIFAALGRNPMVRLEARLGLSPAPLERFTGIRGFFSGMTEATVRLAHLDFLGAARANILVFPTIAAAAAVILLWRAPKLHTRRQEIAFFAFIILGTLINNVVPPLLSVRTA